MTEKEFRVQMIDQFSINMVFNYTQPFSRESIINKLLEKKFVVIQSNIPDILGRSPHIAKNEKGDITIDYIPENGVIGVSGNEFAVVIKNFEILLKLINDIMGTEVDNNIIRLYEVIAHVRVGYSKDSKETTEPREIISNFIGKEKLKKFESIFKNPSFFTIRITPDKELPNKTEWYDVVVEPLYINPKQYHIGIVYRSQDIENIKNLTKEMENKIIHIVSQINEG